MAKDSTPILIQQDPLLANIITTVGTLPEINSNPVFHDLIACIVEQQIPYRSTKKIFEKLLTKARISVITPENFDDFERLGMVDLKLSTNKIETLQRILQSWSEMPANWSELSDEEIRNIFKQIKGIGPWTVDMLLLYTFQRPNVFPADDYHLKQIMPKLYGLDPKSRLKAQMKSVAEDWSPHASLAVRYLLEWKTIGKK